MSEEYYQELIYKMSYARWNYKESRREVWSESVERYKNYMIKKIKDKKAQEVFSKACNFILEKKIMPSMRAFWTAGEALDRDNIAAYNCCYVTIDNIKVFSEILYILMCGTGVGFSVERNLVEKLPIVPELKESSDKIVFVDSKRGWAEGYNKFIRKLYKGEILQYDLSKLRPEGAILKTFGGRASGPGPLKSLLENTKSIFLGAIGRKLHSLECHDIVCYIASAIVSGGVRRSACISLSDLSDERLAKAKTGEFWHTNPQRRLSNNSAVYNEKPSARKFMSEWIKLIESKCGERGIFNRMSAKYTAANTGRRDPEHEFGGNPCLEILLRPSEFCNLSEAVLKSEDRREDIIEKVKYATILGCVQSTLTDFNFIGKKYKNNCKEERLLGVSLTGLADHPVLNNVSRTSKKWLHEMKEEAIDTAKDWAKILGINVPAAITCVKPSGTVSQLVGCSSGIHPRYSSYYIRRIRMNSYDPLAKLLINSGINYNPEVGQMQENAITYVFDFYIKSPKNSLTKDEVTAIQQLEYWKMLKDHWCEHNPSCTIYVKENEWISVAAWIYDNWNSVCGLSFLPYNSGIHQLAPYEEIDEDIYNEMSKKISINFDKLNEYEQEDMTEGAKEYACVGGTCEI